MSHICRDNFPFIPLFVLVFHLSCVFRIKHTLMVYIPPMPCSVLLSFLLSQLFDAMFNLLVTLVIFITLVPVSWEASPFAFAVNAFLVGGPASVLILCTRVGLL